MGGRIGAHRAGEPRIVELPGQTMAVTTTAGDPSVVGPAAISALYGAVYALKVAAKRRGADFKVGPLRARWPAVGDPGGLAADRAAWVGLWGLPVPDGTTTLPQKAPDVEVRVERWAYGPVAEVLHQGPYATEPETVARLEAFVAARGYRTVGPHEEEYLTQPTARVQKTIIRYNVAPLAPAGQE
jgi:hypothetical protein